MPRMLGMRTGRPDHHGGFVTEDPRPGLPIQADGPRPTWLPESQFVIRIFAVALVALLVGYMFLGRGFAHLGIGPVYVGDLVLLLGVVTAAFAAMRGRVSPHITWTIALLLAFAALGAVRTIPYLGTYGLDALRDGVLWGYGAFALIVYLLADRASILKAFRLYGWVVPIFALWLPISWNLFATSSAAIDPSRPGSFIPLVFFKGGDMAVHTVGAIAFLVIGARGIRSARTFVWRMLIALPLLWTIFVAGTSNRGALVTAAVGILVVAMLAWRSRNWLPILAAPAIFAIFAIAVLFQGVLAAPGGPAPTPGEPTLLAIPNSDFELGTDGTGTVAGWTTRWGSSWAPDGSGYYNIIAGGGYRSDRFASVQNALKAYEATLTSRRIPFRGGPDIDVSVWVKAIAARPILEIYINWYDSSGTRISSVFLGSLATHGVGTWQQCTGALAAPVKATQVEILFYEASGKATIGIDEVTVKSGYFQLAGGKGRPATLQQMIENLMSIFGPSANGALEGSKQFRLAWWGHIVDYTVFGKYFWTGKGFGVNLADVDGFQSTADHPLRSPHNSEMTVLARMGVPGLILWVLLQGAFVFGLLRAMLAHRRTGDLQLAAIAGWTLAYWVAMTVDTSFDPYLEGPQGGIWFWVVFGLGLVLMSLAPRRRVAA
jgi:hypothetical protein